MLAVGICASAEAGDLDVAGFCQLLPMDNGVLLEQIESHRSYASLFQRTKKMGEDG